jgi:hypothetical protein
MRHRKQQPSSLPVHVKNAENVTFGSKSFVNAFAHLTTVQKELFEAPTAIALNCRRSYLLAFNSSVNRAQSGATGDASAFLRSSLNLRACKIRNARMDIHGVMKNVIALPNARPLSVGKTSNSMLSVVIAFAASVRKIVQKANFLNSNFALAFISCVSLAVVLMELSGGVKLADAKLLVTLSWTVLLAIAGIFLNAAASRTQAQRRVHRSCVETMNVSIRCRAVATVH